MNSLLFLIDDIAGMMKNVSVFADDVGLMTKVAAKKTAGILGDDLALNAEQVQGVSASRELPVIWKIFKGSLLNKLIIVPVFLFINAFFSWLMTPLLIVGGAYLCFEGVEKIYHKFFIKKPSRGVLHNTFDGEVLDKKDLKNEIFEEKVSEKEKIKGAIRTDFILSVEIIAIAMNSIGSTTFLKQLTSISLIAVGVTVFIYLAVALLIRFDDMGLFLIQSSKVFVRKLGKGILLLAPVLMKVFGIVGTAAMFLVGGGLIVHRLGLELGWGMNGILVEGVVGVLVGLVVFGVVEVRKRIF